MSVIEDTKTSFDDHLSAEWSEMCRSELAYVASERTTITYGRLYDVLHSQGWPVAVRPPGRAGNNWAQKVGNLLKNVAQLNKLYEEPLLTSLVRNGDNGKVSEGYRHAVHERYGVSLVGDRKIVFHSQAEAPKCYGAFVAGTGKILGAEDE